VLDEVDEVEEVELDEEDEPELAVESFDPPVDESDVLEEVSVDEVAGADELSLIRLSLR
jgi:hypothetical protein